MESSDIICESWSEQHRSCLTLFRFLNEERRIPAARFVPSRVYNFVNAPYPTRFTRFGCSEQKENGGICVVKILVFAVGKKTVLHSRAGGF